MCIVLHHTVLGCGSVVSCGRLPEQVAAIWKNKSTDAALVAKYIGCRPYKWCRRKYTCGVDTNLKTNICEYGKYLLMVLSLRNPSVTGLWMQLLSTSFLLYCGDYYFSVCSIFSPRPRINLNEPNQMLPLVHALTKIYSVNSSKQIIPEIYRPDCA